MQLQIAKWGNSLAVRLPSAVTKKLHIADGDSVDLTLNNQGELVLTPAKVFDKAAFMQQLATHTKKLPKTTPVIDAMRDSERY
jgi:antitoxin MazE